VPTVDGPARWKADVRDMGPEWVLSATCPQCRTALYWNIAPGPALTVADDAHAVMLGPDGHDTEPGAFAAFEQRRAAGRLPHTESADIDFQLWCHRCMIGAAATVHGD
jgi:hypothetical protein